MKVHIVECDESNIYIDSSVESITINSCINCTIFVAAVTKVCTVEKCENLTLCVAANQLRVGNCVDTVVHSYTTNLGPIVYGDTRNLRLGPHNAFYSKMADHLKRANVRFEIAQNEKDTLSDWFVE